MEESVIVEEGGLLEDLVEQGGRLGVGRGGWGVGMVVELVDSSPVGRVGRIIPRTGEAALPLGTLENPRLPTTRH